MLAMVFRCRGALSLTISMADGRGRATTMSGNVVFDEIFSVGVRLVEFRAECRAHLVRTNVCSPHSKLVFLQGDKALRSNRILAEPNGVKKAMCAACVNYVCVAVKTAFFRARVHAWVCGCALTALHARQSSSEVRMIEGQLRVGLADIAYIGRTPTALADSIRLKGNILHALISNRAVNTALIAKCPHCPTCAYTWDSGWSALYFPTSFLDVRYLLKHDHRIYIVCRFI